jgi:hypothetical protein
MELRLETGFVGSASDLRFDELIVHPAIRADEPIAPLLVALICASPLVLVPLLLYLWF